MCTQRQQEAHGAETAKFTAQSVELINKYQSLQNVWCVALIQAALGAITAMRCMDATQSTHEQMKEREKRKILIRSFVFRRT